MVISNLENSEYLDQYDYIIQHGPVGLLNGNINNIAKNVAIPLIDKIYNKYTYHDILSDFDYVLVDSDEYYEFLCGPTYNFTNVKKYDYTKIYSSSQLINFNYFQHDTKMYLVGNYTLSILEKIIKSFYLAFYHKDDISLLIFLNQQDITNEQVNQMLNVIKTDLNMQNTIDNVNIFIKELDVNEMAAIHASCDIFLDISFTNAESSLHRHIARSCNNKIITLSDLETYPDVQYKKFFINETIQNFSDLSLSFAMTNSVIKPKDPQQNNNKSIVDVLCQ